MYKSVLTFAVFIAMMVVIFCLTFLYIDKRLASPLEAPAEGQQFYYTKCELIA